MLPDRCQARGGQVFTGLYPLSPQGNILMKQDIVKEHSPTADTRRVESNRCGTDK